MRQPHLCPKCNGARVLGTNALTRRSCPTCNGAGVLWEPAAIGGFHPDPVTATPDRAIAFRIDSGKTWCDLAEAWSASKEANRA